MSEPEQARPRPDATPEESRPAGPTRQRQEASLQQFQTRLDDLQWLLGHLWRLLGELWGLLRRLLRPLARGASALYARRHVADRVWDQTFGRLFRAIDMDFETTAEAFAHTMRRLGRTVVLVFVAGLAFPFFVLTGLFNARGLEGTLISLLFFGGGGLAILVSGWAFVPLLRSNRWLGLVLVLLWLVLGARLRVLGHEDAPGPWMVFWGTASLAAALSYLFEEPRAFKGRQGVAELVLVLAAGLVVFVNVPALKDPELVRQARRQEAEQAAVALCEAQAGMLTSAPFVAEGLADSTGALDADALSVLLVHRRLRYVDMQVRPNAEGRGVLTRRLTHGPGELPAPTDGEGAWIRMTLAASDHPGCWPAGTQELSRSLESMPVLPGSCLAVTPIPRTDAPLQLIWRAATAPGGPRQLALVDREGAQLMALPTGEVLSFSRVSGEPDAQPQASDCRAAHSVMLTRVRGPEFRQADGSRVLNQVPLDMPPVLEEQLNDAQALPLVPAQLRWHRVSDEERQRWRGMRDQDTWAEQWAQAVRDGVARCGPACLIRPASFSVLERRLVWMTRDDPARSISMWADARGVWQTGRELSTKEGRNLVLMRDFQGRVLAAAYLQLPRELEKQDSWHIEGVHSEKGSLLLMIGDRHIKEAEQWELQLLQVPLDRLKRVTLAAPEAHAASGS